jgi:hypothetical protein
MAFEVYRRKPPQEYILANILLSRQPMHAIAAWSSRVLEALRNRRLARARNARPDVSVSEVTQVKGYAVLVQL